jgi:hypothetical protein
VSFCVLIEDPRCFKANKGGGGGWSRCSNQNRSSIARWAFDVYSRFRVGRKLSRIEATKVSY